MRTDILQNKKDQLKQSLARTTAQRKRRREDSSTNSNSVLIDYCDTSGIPKRLRLLIQEPDRPLMLRIRLRRPREDDQGAEEDAYGRCVRRRVDPAEAYF